MSTGCPKHSPLGCRRSKDVRTFFGHPREDMCCVGVYVISVDCFPTMKPPQDYLGRPKGKQQWFISRLDEGSFKMWAQGKRMLLLKWTDGISWRSMPAQCSDLGNAIFTYVFLKKVDFISLFRPSEPIWTTTFLWNFILMIKEDLQQ